MSSEFNEPFLTPKQTPDKHTAKEHTSYSNPAPKEHHSTSSATNEKRTSTSSSSSPKVVKKKSSMNVMSLVSSVAAIGSAAIIGVSAGIISTAPDIYAEITIQKITDISVLVDVYCENIGDETVYISVSNNFVDYRVEAIEGENSLVFPDLQPDMSYELAVKGDYGIGGSTVIAKQSFKTIRTDRLPVSRFDSVEHECKCNVDGYFHFKMNFVDENNYWSNFYATLTDEKGTVSHCVFTSDPHEEQLIDVIGAPLVGNTATLTIGCHSSDINITDESQRNVVFYSQTVSI